MIAAYIWHWWIGLALTGVGIAAVIGIGAGYLRAVTAKRLPPEHQSGVTEGETTS
jgi:hypothetical protein